MQRDYLLPKSHACTLCSDAQVQALGNYILKHSKPTRSTGNETCRLNNMQFLAATPAKIKTDFDPIRMAGEWLRIQKETPEQVFQGAEATTKAIFKRKTLNVLIDRSLKTHRFILRNKNTTAQRVGYFTDKELYFKMKNDEAWMYLDILQCQSFMFYIAKNMDPTDDTGVTFTVVDASNSNAEMRFITASGGIGGFYKAKEKGFFDFD